MPNPLKGMLQRFRDWRFKRSSKNMFKNFQKTMEKEERKAMKAGIEPPWHKAAREAEEQKEIDKLKKQFQYHVFKLHR